MKRALILLLLAVPAFGLTKTKPEPKTLQPGDRIGVLLISEEFAQDVERNVASAVLRDLQRELKALGFEAFDAKMTFEDAERVAPASDYYVEIVAGHAQNTAHGRVTAAIGPAVVDLGIVTARVAAELRLYDARTMDLVERFDLSKRNFTFAPTGVGLGVQPIWAYIALPLVNYGQYRYAARSIAREAAYLIAHR